MTFLIDAITVFGNLIKDNFGNILTLVALYVAYRSLRVSTQSFNEHNRPYITANIEKGDESHKLYLIIRNDGIRGAQDINIKFNPPLNSQLLKDIPELSQISGRSYAFIAPQQTIKSTFDYTLHRFAEYVKCENKFSIDITYKYVNRTFAENYIIDIDYIKHLVGSNESDIKAGFKQLDKTLEKLVKSTK